VGARRTLQPSDNPQLTTLERTPNGTSGRGLVSGSRPFVILVWSFGNRGRVLGGLAV
jgi:hypothetical protein